MVAVRNRKQAKASVTGLACVEGSVWHLLFSPWLPSPWLSSIPFLLANRSHEVLWQFTPRSLTFHFLKRSTNPTSSSSRVHCFTPFLFVFLILFLKLIIPYPTVPQPTGVFSTCEEFVNALNSDNWAISDMIIHMALPDTHVITNHIKIASTERKAR